MTQYELAVTLRIILIVLCTLCVAVMLIGFIRFRQLWNEKTRDYWFGRIMWSFAGGSSAIEAIYRHTPIRYTIVFFIFAALVTLKGALKRGSWGTPELPPSTKSKKHKPKSYTG